MSIRAMSHTSYKALFLLNTLLMTGQVLNKYLLN